MTGEPSRRGRGRPPHPDILTPREWQVLDLLRQDLTNEQIAQRLDISLAGAKYHVSEILTKLGVTTREEAAAWEPEPTPARRRWAVAIAWAARRGWPLAGAAGSLAVIGVLAWVILGASAGDEGSAVQTETSPSPSGSPTPGASPTPQDVTFAPLTISNPEDTKLLSIRGARDYLGPGSLWMSDLDGADPRMLVENGVSSVIGVVPNRETGNPSAYYYTTEDISELTPSEYLLRQRLTISNIDLVTGERTHVLTFDTWGGQAEGAADVTADGRYLAYTDEYGLSVRGLMSGESRLVLGSEQPRVPCRSANWETFQCNGFGSPRWSADGSMIVFFQAAYEGGRLVIVDPFAENSAPVPLDFDVWRAEWSPSGQALCLVDTGGYDNDAALAISRAPDWQPQLFLADYQSDLVEGPEVAGITTEGMGGCIWLDENNVAVIHHIVVGPQNSPREILVLNVSTGEVRGFREHNEFWSARDLLPISHRNLLVSTPHKSPDYPDPIGDTLTPEVVHVETGARRPILTLDDWVVAAVPAEALEP